MVTTSDDNGDVCDMLGTELKWVIIALNHKKAMKRV